MDDIDEAVYPATINEDLVDYGHVPDNVDDAGGADAAAFLGLGNVTEAAAAPVPPVSESQSCGSKRRSPVWDNFDEILDDKRVRIAAVCKFCRHRLSAKSAAGTGHLLRHQNACKKKADHAKMVQTRLAMNPDGSYRNWEYKPDVARVELCKLIARLDLSLSVADNDAWDDYIQRAHNPRHVRVSRFSTSRDLEKLFIDTINNLKHIVFPGVNSICLTSDIWSGNAKEDYITVVAHFINSDWQLKKHVIGFRLIEEAHTGTNIAERISDVVEAFGMTDKIFAVSLDNASSNNNAMQILAPIFSGYLGVDTDPDNPSKKTYYVVHQRCACHVINLIVKSGLKRLKPYIEIFRTAISYLNASNKRIAEFKDYCLLKGVRPRKFGLDMDVRWNSTYLMLKHLIPYKNVFSVFINGNIGYAALNGEHWYVAEKVCEFLELFYESTVALSGVYYPTSPLVLHHIIEIATHFHECRGDSKLETVIGPMRMKFEKYWKKIPMLYSFAFILDPRAKLRGLHMALDLLAKSTSYNYNLYANEVKHELFKLYNKYENKFAAARPARTAHPSGLTGKRKQAWGKIFGGPGGSGTSGPSSNIPIAGTCELTAYLDSDNVVAYDDSFDILNWWHDHKLTYPVLSIMAKDIMSVPVSTTSSESCFSQSGRILEDRRRRLNPETVEQLIIIKDWELAARRAQHSVEDLELEEKFKNLWLDEDNAGAAAGDES